MKKKLLIILGIFITLTPLGLLTNYDAWGEWDLNYYKEKLGFIPNGMENSSGITPIIPDYSIAGTNDIISYYISAIVGAILIFGIFYILAKLNKKNETN